MSDCDDLEELLATRRLHGLNDNLFKKINTEDDIKRCEQLTKPEHANWIGISNQMAIIGVLARIKELEDKNQKKSIEIICYQEELENSIPVQKIQDKIEENKEYRKYANTAFEYTQQEVHDEIVKAFEELLEEK